MLRLAEYCFMSEIETVKLAILGGIENTKSILKVYK